MDCTGDKMDTEIDIQDLHFALLKLLKKFDSVCRTYGVDYSIGFGTMLGAIRHKGFIPWDDDVDIIITRENYQKLLGIPLEVYGEDFFLQNVYTDRGYPYNTTRLRLNNSSMIYEKWVMASFHQGIYIDIIPLDNVPDNRIKKYKQSFDIIMLTPFRFARNKEVFFNGGKNIPNFIKRFAYSFMKMFPLDKLYEKEQRIEKKYNKQETKYMRFLSEGNLLLKRWYPTKPIESRYMMKFVEVEFEDTKLLCSAYYKELLEFWYGDYMQLPPKEKQVIYHKPLFVSSKVSYKQFQKEYNK